MHAGPTSHTHTEHPRHDGNNVDSDVERKGSTALSSSEDLSPSITMDSDALAQIVGIAILEFGVMFHSIIIGITLAVNADFKTLFVVIVFHRRFSLIFCILCMV